MRAALALVFCLSGAALADSPGIPRWEAARPAACADFDHPDAVAAAISATHSCRAAMALYLRCEGRWYNSEEMEEAAVNACDNEVPPFSDRLKDRYESLREGCIERYQAKDMRILWSAVRACRVRLARSWAQRYGKAR